MNTIKKTHKKIIGIDFDDIVFDFNDSLHVFHNSKYGTNITRKDATTYDIDKIWNCTPEEAAEKVLEFCNSKNHDETMPIAGSIEALNKLSLDHELHIITSRGERVSDSTFRWIHKNFPNNFKSVNLTNHYFGFNKEARLKSDVCRELGVEIMIEDSLSQVIDIAPVVKQVILFDCPWNQGELPNNVIRVYSWSEVLKIIYAD